MSTKSPNLVKPLILAVVLCTLGGFTYWLEYSKKPRDQKIEADSKKVFTLKGAAISKLELRGASTKPENSKRPPLSVALACGSLANKLCHFEDASRWDLVEPLQTKADDTTVNSLLKNFGNMTTNETIDLSTETAEKRAQLLKDYGIDAAARANPATRRIALTFEGANRITAYFGAKHPIGDGVFTVLATGEAVDENRVLVVPDWQISVFDQKTSYFRNKNLFGLNEKEVVAFKLGTSKKIPNGLEAKRSADGKGWVLKQGSLEVEGDVDTVDGVLSAVAHLVAKDVATERKESSEGKAAIAGAKNIYDLKLTTKDGEKRLRLFEKKRDPKAVASIYALVEGSDPVFEIDAYGAEKIDKTLDELRVGKLISIADRYSITAIDIEAQGKESFTQSAKKDSGGHWKIGATETGRGKIEGILDRLTSKVVTTYSGAAPAGDRLKMTFKKGVEKSPIAELEFWSTKGRLYARNLVTPKKEIVELAPDFHTSLPWTAKTLFDEPSGVKK